MAGGWRLFNLTGSAGALQDGSAGALNALSPERQARFLFADRPALVLGSHQDEAMFDRAALDRAGLALARRPSGGSAVLVGPGQVLWMDLLVPAGDPLWDDDVSRAAWWVGEMWARAIASLDTGSPEVWKGRMRRNAWSPAVCFAGLAPGEVTVDGAKVVGVSQRRTARATLFQTAALLRWDPGSYTKLMSSPLPNEALPPIAGLGEDTGPRLQAALTRELVP